MPASSTRRPLAALLATLAVAGCVAVPAGAPPRPYPGPGPVDRPDYGRPDYGRPDYGRPDYGRPDYGRPDYGRPEYGRPDRPRPDSGRACQANRARFAIGENATNRVAESAAARSGAGIVRIVGPGDAVTRDFRPDRLTLETDRRGRVVAVSCG